MTHDQTIELKRILEEAEAPQPDRLRAIRALRAAIIEYARSIVPEPVFSRPIVARWSCQGECRRGGAVTVYDQRDVLAAVRRNHRLRQREDPQHCRFSAEDVHVSTSPLRTANHI